MKCRLMMLGAVMLAAGWLAAPALADPLPGQILKFSQLPMDGTLIGDATGTVVPYYGHDELSTAVSFFGQDPTGAPVLLGYQGIFMADDFADRFNTPVLHVRWWGSYIHNEIIQPVDKFLIAFESDVPANPDVAGSFSRPGEVLLTQIVRKGPLAPGSGTYTEAIKSPGGPPLGEVLYEYNAELKLPFHQEPDTVYWLKIVALVDVEPEWTGPVTQWGWHNRDYTIHNPLASVPPGVVPGEYIDGVLPDGQPIWHFQDDAVSGNVLVFPNPDFPDSPALEQFNMQPQNYVDLVDGPGPSDEPPFEGIRTHSKDLAFELYTVPEPATLGLLGAGAVAAVLGIRRRRT